MNPPVEAQVCRPSVSIEHRAPARHLELDDLQAQRWLEYLAGAALGGDHAHALAEFREQLDDALWLAKWKREYVMIELELTAVPTLIAAISSHESSVLCDRSLDIQEDILATLSEMSGWT